MLAEWRRIDVSALASQVAYSLIFSIPSLMLFLMALAAWLDMRAGLPVAGTMRDAINENAPGAVREVLLSIVDDAVVRIDTGVASASAGVALLIAIWGSSSGINTLVGACNRAYGVPDNRSFVAKRVLALVLTGVFAIFGVVTAVIFIGGDSLERAAFRRTSLNERYMGWWDFLKWPVYVLTLSSALVLLYWIGSIARSPARWTLPGALLGASSWLLLLSGFRYLLSVIRPGTPYGATGSLLALLVFLYGTGVVFIMGAAFNGLLIRFYRPKS
jgi:membrane protein